MSHMGCTEKNISGYKNNGWDFRQSEVAVPLGLLWKFQLTWIFTPTHHFDCFKSAIIPYFNAFYFKSYAQKELALSTLPLVKSYNLKIKVLFQNQLAY